MKGFEEEKQMEEFVWRDKAIELMIRSVKAKLDKLSLFEYFKQYDSRHMDSLTPGQFRQACLDLHEP